jgi:hypothetical protein
VYKRQVGRFGLRKSIPLLAVAIPSMLVMFAGRMTNISMSNNDTAQGRMMLWREGFAQLKRTFGIGLGCNILEETIGHVAHNSFVQAYVEIGILGGALFAQMFWGPIRILWKKRSPVLGLMTRDEALLEWWRPGLLAAIVGYAVGLCSLTKTYTISTYMITGVGAAYMETLALYRPWELPALNRDYYKSFAKVGLGVLAFFYLWCRVF